MKTKNKTLFVVLAALAVCITVGVAMYRYRDPMPADPEMWSATPPTPQVKYQ